MQLCCLFCDFSGARKLSLAPPWNVGLGAVRNVTFRTLVTTAVKHSSCNSQEIPRAIWKATVHGRLHNSPPLALTSNTILPTK